uniref:Activating transcription factor 7-interacting protein Fn3 domain-containing protein n=1 Tax=Ornithorhynchus anatinus TaxID=9258 RepID=A0A6I8NH94_ORNAN
MKDALAAQKAMLEASKLPQDTSPKAATSESVILNKQDSRKYRKWEREQCLNQGPSKHLKGNTVKIQESTVTSNFNSKQTNFTSITSKQMAQNSGQPVDQYAHLPPLPEPPSHFKLESRVMGTFPPQKPELKLKRVYKPQGVALSWNICKIDPKCAPVESYHLFICQENTAGNCPSVWRKIGEIKALPLPMACTLSHFSFSGTCYFAVQSKDIYGRYGPFCDIKSIPGSSEEPNGTSPGPL